MDENGVTLITVLIPAKNKENFSKWVKGIGSTVDEKSKFKAYELFKSSLIDEIEGMMCGHCEAHTKQALEAVEGVSLAEVSHKSGTAKVTLAKPVSDDALKQAVDAAGYKVVDIA